ncbi:MAG: hypothetical protein K2X93_07715 [Candidatus Obscuribacterales bacterium]|nr:hypothetical protein [Candidatus Obscuribacterales bacterium]
MDRFLNNFQNKISGGYVLLFFCFLTSLTLIPLYKDLHNYPLLVTVPHIKREEFQRLENELLEARKSYDEKLITTAGINLARLYCVNGEHQKAIHLLSELLDGEVDDPVQRINLLVAVGDAKLGTAGFFEKRTECEDAYVTYSTAMESAKTLKNHQQIGRLFLKLISYKYLKASDRLRSLLERELAIKEGLVLVGHGFYFAKDNGDSDLARALSNYRKLLTIEGETLPRGIVVDHIRQ